MKTVWIAGIATLAATAAFAQTTIYKHVDESGRITYSNKPMKGATVMELEPIMTMPGTPAPVAPSPQKAVPGIEKANLLAIDKPDAKPVAAVVTPLTRATLAAVEPQLQRKRDEDRRRILAEELAREEESLTTVRTSLVQEQQNPILVAAVRAAQQATDPTPTQLTQFRDAIEKASGRIRGLQATVTEHEKNIEALKKELGSLKP
jgi:hypothetical protein